MDLIEEMLEDGWCVYWPMVDNNVSPPIYGDAQEISCRWEEVNELFQGQGGQEVSNAKVYVGIDLTLQGLLRKGKMEDLDSLTDPLHTNTNVYVIRKFNKIPTIDQSDEEFLRFAYL